MWSINTRLTRALRVIGPRAHARVPYFLKHFATSSRGRILDDFPNINVTDAYETRPEDRERDRVIRGRTTYETIGESLEYLAIDMATLYTFDHDDPSGPRIEDVLRARHGPWEYIRYEESADYEYYSYVKGETVAIKALPEIFSVDEWVFIERMVAEFSKGPADGFTLQEALTLAKLALRPSHRTRR